MGGRGAGAGVVAILIGVALVLENLGLVRFHVWHLWPLLLIACGMSLLLRGPDCYAARRRYRYRYSRDYGEQGGGTGGAASEPSRGGGSGGGAAAAGGAGTAPAAVAEESYVEGLAVLGGYQRRITAQNFRGGRITACLGGYNLDLSRAEIAGDTAVLDVFACFGGGEIRVPEHWAIEEQMETLLGGCNDETRQTPPASGAKKLIVRGSAILGGVVIKN